MVTISITGSAWRLAFAGVLALAVSGPAAADFDEGIAAYKRGDFQTAYKAFLPPARAGHADAQYGLGFLYLEGRGVKRDYAESVKWYRKAAAVSSLLSPPRSRL